MRKRTDTCIESKWQYVGVTEMEPTTKVLNTASTV